MIKLSNGDHWILDDSEWENADIPYEDATARKIPTMSVREFIEKLAASHKEESVGLLPRKWTNEFPEGYWDGNFDVYEEVFTDTAVHKITNPWSKVYIMPWKHIYVIYQKADIGGYDVCTGINKFDSLADYVREACQHCLEVFTPYDFRYTE